MNMEASFPEQNRPAAKKIITIVANLLIIVMGLLTGAAIVHGTVLKQCSTKQEPFVAGVVPPELLQPGQEADAPDIEKCLESKNGESFFVAGVLPEDTGVAAQPQVQQVPEQNAADRNPEPSVQGATPVQTSAPAPQPAPAPQKSQNDPAKPSQPAVQPSAAKPAPSTAKKTSSTKPAQQKTEPQKVTVKNLSYDLDKLSIAVAMTETHNCRDKVGSALYNNCHGFRKNGKFMRFNNTSESHAYFKQLWARSYKSYPNMTLAKIYSGNDNPVNWLKNVNYYYNSL